MQYAAIARILGIFLILHSFGLIPPLVISLRIGDGQYMDFILPLTITLGSGSVVWFFFRNAKQELRRREGFLIVAAFWLVLSAFSALPLMIGGHLNFVDAFFEATSAFTTTGASVMTGLDATAKSILFYRSELQWLGGMGIIVLAVAVLPLLGVGGMQLFRAETPGPFKDEKLTPRIAHSAQHFWVIYIGLTLACTIGYVLSGMSLFDAVTHSFSTLSTGGFSTHDASMAYFHSLPIEILTEVFMFLGALNFSIHFLVFRRLNLMYYLSNPEILAFTLIVAGAVLIGTVVLYFEHTYASFFTALRNSAFTTISVITSTGYTTQNFAAWPTMLPAFMMFISFIGGCSGSTAGGMKVIRVMLLFKQGYRELLQLIHPAMVRPIKMAGRPVPPAATMGIWGFFAWYVALFVLAMLLLMAGGMDQVTAFSAVTTCINNMGPGLGKVAANFKDIDDYQKIILAMCMLIGRLEIFTLLVLLSPTFWKN
jgi:trk system potassium uptake protein TrkH